MVYRGHASPLKEDTHGESTTHREHDADQAEASCRRAHGRRKRIPNRAEPETGHGREDVGEDDHENERPSLASLDVEEPNYSNDSTIPCVHHCIDITDRLGDHSGLGDWQFICHNRLWSQYSGLLALSFNLNISARRAITCIPHWQLVGKVHAELDIYNIWNPTDVKPWSTYY